MLLLTGPGGEGKSMVLRQAVAAMLVADPKLNLLWHADDTLNIPAKLLDKLPDGPWLIATDAADLTAKSLLQLTAELHRARPTDVRLLLCARDTDWRASGAAKLEWYRHADYRMEQLSGLSEVDAALIAAVWIDFDATVAPSDPAAGAAALYEAAKHEAAVSEGSLLGGALAVRRGAGLREHVHRLLDRLGEQRLPSGDTLYHAFGYIAAMHAEGLDFLSRPVLARVLGCDPNLLSKQVVIPLAREAAAGGGSVLLTRHRSIAEAAVSIMGEELGEDVAGRFEELARAAIAARLDGVFVPELHKWDYSLPEHFVEKAPETAIRIGTALLDEDPGNASLAVNLAQIYRKCDEPAAGADVLVQFAGEVGNDRGFWSEWGTCAGNSGDYAVSAILSGWSLADQANAGPPDNRQAKLSLAGLGVAFGDLYERFRDPRFVAGRSAVAHLGLNLGQDTKRGYFEGHQRDAEAAGVRTADTAEALQQLCTALIAAWDVCGRRDDLAVGISPPASMSFSGLARLFGQRVAS